MNETVFNTNYTREQFILMLKNGECPICGKKNYKVVMIHVNRIHGISSIELTDTLMLPHEFGFVSDEKHIELSNKAQNMGLGKKVKSDYTTKGRKWSKNTRDKQLVDRRKPKRAKAISEHWKQYIENNPGKAHELVQQAGKSASKSRWGNEEGYNDLFYCKVSQKYIDILNNSNTYRNVLIELGKHFDVSKSLAYYYINTACKRGLILMSGVYSNRKATLTEKAVHLLNYNN